MSEATFLVRDPSQATENFNWREFFCPVAKIAPVSDLTLHHLNKLQALRDELGEALKVNSGYRCPQHNEAVGGVAESMHLEFATDIAPLYGSTGASMEGLPNVLNKIVELAENLGFSGIGCYTTFVHLDCRAFIDRPQARWENRYELKSLRNCNNTKEGDS